MAIETLNITFAGTCVHLHDLVPGVPMRTVLPRALEVHFGTIWIPEGDPCQPQPAMYYLLPHVPWIRTAATGDVGWMLNGQYLRIVNAVGPYEPDLSNTFSLSHYVRKAELDEGVVFGGNAACYFDTSHGKVWTEGSGNEPRVTRVQVQTDGTPILHVAPLPGAYPAVEAHDIPIKTNELFVTNLDFDPACEYRNFDFLLNYLVVKGGIPKVLTRRVPGMTPESQSVTLQRLGLRLKALGEAVTTFGTVLLYKLNGGAFSSPSGDQAKPLQSPPPGKGSLQDGAFPGLMIDPVPFDTSCSPGNLP